MDLPFASPTSAEGHFIVPSGIRPNTSDTSNRSESFNTANTHKLFYIQHCNYRKCHTYSASN